MALWARLDGEVVIETFEHGEDPSALFDPSWTWIEVPAGTVQHSVRDGDDWVHPPAPPAPEPAAAERILQVSPPTFLLLFEPGERLAIRAARAYAGSDAAALKVKAVLEDWFAIIEDPRLQYVDLALPATQDGLDFLVTVGLLTAPRAAAIKQGVAR